jgi:DNA-binding protein YbaB
MANILQMAQKAAQFKTKLQELQERVRATDMRGAADGVACVMDGRFVLKSLEIDDAVTAGDKRAMIALIDKPVNDGRDKAEQLMTEETKKLMDDLGLPPGLGLPF